MGALVLATAMFLGGKLAWTARTPVDRWLGIAFATGFGLLGGWCVVAGLWARVDVSAAGVREHTLRGGVRELAWADVRRVEERLLFRMLTLHGENVSVSADFQMWGFNDLILAVEANVPEEIWAQAWPAPPRVSR